ncbi:MAG: TPM domain-containing protein [Clostridia bacterium]|nr:TPM domain-containing protein [Clostridia bacterium]
MKKIFSALICAILIISALSVTVISSDSLPLLVDEDGVLSKSEASELSEKLEDISERWKTSIIIVTVKSLGAMSPEAYANDFYDSNGYGDAGILLLVCPASGDGYILTQGRGRIAISDDMIDYVAGRISDDLSADNYASAFMIFADTCDEFLMQADSGSPYSTSNPPREPYNFFKALIISLLLGLVIAFIATAIMKSQLKSVRSKDSAADYVIGGSLNVTLTRDLFLYSKVTRVPIPKNDSGSGRSSGSSGGRGGGSFKF